MPKHKDGSTPRPCPQCGKKPCLIQGFGGWYYVICVGHHETDSRRTEDEAVRDWNEGRYDPGGSSSMPAAN